jgi:parallel beta-helix repeat protein
LRARNNITAHNYVGIWLDSSSGNSISGNNITDNDYGVYFGEYGYVSVGSFNNTIYHNNFRNNTKQVYDISWDYPQDIVPSINVWDDGYPSGGNYWSDYNGTDANHDGIGDTPYIIDANNTDNYPLMTQYVIPEFPSFLILPLFMIATLLAVMVYKKKGVKTSQS